MGVRITSAGAFFGESAIIESVKGKGTDFHRRIRTVRVAQGESVIWTDNDSNDSKVTMQTLKE